VIDARTKYNPDPAYLRGLIARAGISQREAARRIGIDIRTMRRYLQPDPTVRVAYATQVALEVLAGDHGTRQPRLTGPPKVPDA